MTRERHTAAARGHRPDRHLDQRGAARPRAPPPRFRRRAPALRARRPDGRGPLPLPRRAADPDRALQHRPTSPWPRAAARLRRATPPVPRPRAPRLARRRPDHHRADLPSRHPHRRHLLPPHRPNRRPYHQKRARAAGFDPREFAGHSLRSGYATQAARDGHHPTQIAATTRHQDQRVLAGYIRAGRDGDDIAHVL